MCINNCPIVKLHKKDKIPCVTLGMELIWRAGASPPSRTTGPCCLYNYIY